MNYIKHFPSTPFLSDPSHARIGVTPFPDKLYVVTMLSNPVRWRSRYHNYNLFESHVLNAGAQLYTVEVAFGGRPFEITETENPRHIQFRTDHELWHKENALNLAIQRLPVDAKYVAWIDADVTFARPDWVQETMQLLQHYDFIQMFSTAVDLNVKDEPSQTHRSFMASYHDGMNDPLNFPKLPSPSTIHSGDSGKFGSYWHPGFAWAARKESLAKVGMLIDWAILGSADWHMAWGLIGQMNAHLVPGLNENYKNWCREWQNRAEQHIKRNVGCMNGTLLHHFHGSKQKRAYGERWKFLIDAGFNPVVDIKKDHQGLWQLSGNNNQLRDAIRIYSRMRNEDEN